MSTFLRTLRGLVLGETWTLPLGVALVLVAGALLREAAPGFWEDAGGFVLLGGVVAVLLVAVRGGA
jgi:hypothetical protein